MLKPLAISTAAVIAIIGIDWMILNGYRNYLAIPLIALWLFTAIGLIRFMRKGGN